MQTVTLEFRTDDLTLVGIIPSGFFQKYEEAELLETLRLERGWRLQLLRIRSRGPLKSADELERESRRIRRMYGLESFEIVEYRPRTRDYIVLVRQKNPAALRALLSVSLGQITPTSPFRVGEEKTVASFHGEEPALKRILARLSKEGLPYRVVRASAHPYLGDAGDAPLTGKQQAVLARAWALGFFAIPRKITLSRLAFLTGVSPPALGKMLRRAEGTLVARFLASALPGEALAEPVHRA